MPAKYIRGTVAERFWPKVDKSGDCWLWVAGKCRDGYGSFRVAGRSLGAHCVSWELAFGPVPQGMKVCHTCDTPACVRPDHLFLGTDLDNMRDRERKGRGRQPKGEAHGQAVLTDEQVRFIRAAAAEGVPLVDLAQQFGVSPTTVGRIVHRVGWRHL